MLMQIIMSYPTGGGLVSEQVEPSAYPSWSAGMNQPQQQQQHITQRPPPGFEHQLINTTTEDQQYSSLQVPSGYLGQLPGVRNYNRMMEFYNHQPSSYPIEAGYLNPNVNEFQPRATQTQQTNTQMNCESCEQYQNMVINAFHQGVIDYLCANGHNVRINQESQTPQRRGKKNPIYLREKRRKYRAKVAERPREQRKPRTGRSHEDRKSTRLNS